MHKLYEKADKLSREIIGAAMDVHRHKGPGWAKRTEEDDGNEISL